MNLMRLIAKVIPMMPFVVLIVTIFAMGYVKAPTNKAYIISGFKKKPRVLIGRAGIKIPFLERKDELLLKQISIDIKTNGYIHTHDFVGVDIDAVAKVRMLTDDDITIGPDGEYLEGVAKDENKKISKGMVDATMRNFLNMSEEEIREALTDSLQGNMREIIGTQNLKELCNDRKKFGDEVQSKAQRDMNALGIWIESCNIQKIEDEKGLIAALGEENTSVIKRNAAIVKAQADRDVEIAQAEAEKAANDARVKAETEIAAKNNELEIKKAELKKVSDTKKAEADAAYEIQRQEQEKTVQTATVNAQIAKAEREAELKAREVEIKQQHLEAEIKKKADADKYAIEQKAAADLAKRQREAEAERYEQEQAALAERAKAEAEKFKMLQEAEGIEAKGKAEAAAILAKGQAEAQAMKERAEAYEKYGKAAMMEMVVQILPEMAKAVAEPLTSIDKLTIIDSTGCGESGVGTMGNYVPQLLAKTRESLMETMGFDIMDVMKAETYDARVTKNINFSGIPGSPDEKIEEEIKKAVNENLAD